MGQEMASSVPASAAPPRVGEQIQRLRAERRRTLDDLSRAAGVSKSMLSEIERDKANPTLAVAWRLTNALGVSLDSLFAPQKTPEAIAVAGPHEIPTLSGHDAKYQLRVWGPIELAGKFEWYELTLQAGGALVSNAHEPGTREHLTVLQGSIEIEAAGTTKRLKAADTARYPQCRQGRGKGLAGGDSRLRHRAARGVYAESGLARGCAEYCMFVQYR